MFSVRVGYCYKELKLLQIFLRHKKFGRVLKVTFVMVVNLQVIKKNDKPHIEVDVKGKRQLFAAEEISAMVLVKMKVSVLMLVKITSRYFHVDVKCGQK